jgi:peroxiredoxin
MQQVVDLQDDKKFRKLGVELLSISPDSTAAWHEEGSELGITLPTLSDEDNRVWLQFGTVDWMMPSGEPGHTFFLVDSDGTIAWVRDYGAPENGGVMYVFPSEIVTQIRDALGPA